MLEIRVVGPQFGDPWLIMKWLARRYGTKPTRQNVAEHDDLLELEGADFGMQFRAIASVPAIWDRAAVYTRMFSRADAALIVFTRISDLLHLNGEEYEVLLPYLQKATPETIMIANDARCGELATVSGAHVAKALGVPVCETTVGPFTGQLRQEAGMASAWSDLLDMARTRNTGPAS